MKNKCFERKIRKLDRNSKEDSICFNCSNRKIVNGILIDECGIKYGIRDYFVYGSKQEIVDYLKEHNYKTLNDVLEDLN